ncbi:MAG TPA: hypothetical protein VM533_19135 [Fimbriiglobus sp.]|nr:hypothetical protein [Fimbriiglobus sp.]
MIGEDVGVGESGDGFEFVIGLLREEGERPGVGRGGRSSAVGGAGGGDGPAGDVVGALAEFVVAGAEVLAGEVEDLSLGLVEHLHTGAVVHLAVVRVVGVDGGAEVVLGGGEFPGDGFPRRPAGAQVGEPGEQRVGLVVGGGHGTRAVRATSPGRVAGLL